MTTVSTLKFKEAARDSKITEPITYKFYPNYHDHGPALPFGNIGSGNRAIVQFIGKHISGIMRWDEKRTKSGKGVVENTAVVVRPKYRGFGLAKELQEAFISYLNGKYGVTNYSISSYAISPAGNNVINYRRDLMFEPEKQKYDSFDTEDILTAPETIGNAAVKYLRSKGIWATYDFENEMVMTSPYDSKKAKEMLHEWGKILPTSSLKFGWGMPNSREYIVGDFVKLYGRAFAIIQDIGPLDSLTDKAFIRKKVREVAAKFNIDPDTYMFYKVQFFNDWYQLTERVTISVGNSFEKPDNYELKKLKAGLALSKNSSSRNSDKFVYIDNLEIESKSVFAQAIQNLEKISSMEGETVVYAGKFYSKLTPGEKGVVEKDEQFGSGNHKARRLTIRMESGEILHVPYWTFRAEFNVAK